ncbi:hypothetical protein D1872_280930 [compost metagenome]
MIHRWFTAAFQFITIATKAQRRQSALPFNHLSIDIVNICSVAFLTEEGLPRIRRDVIGNIQHTAIHGRD